MVDSPITQTVEVKFMILKLCVCSLANIYSGTLIHWYTHIGEKVILIILNRLDIASNYNNDSPQCGLHTCNI